MINNYLDWVKRQRKYCVKMAVLYGRREREIADDWSKGFFRGLSMAYDFSGQNFKRLQKDIEAMKFQGCSLSVEDDATGFLYRKLS